jgi:hypothetical protein
MGSTLVILTKQTYTAGKKKKQNGSSKVSEVAKTEKKHEK